MKTPICGFCGSKKIQKQADGKKREVQFLDLKGLQTEFQGNQLAVLFCGDCGAIFSMQFVQGSHSEIVIQ